MTLRQQRARYLINNGFLAGEARQLSQTSRQGMLAPYFQRMVHARRMLRQNAIRYGWTDTRYREYIKQQYTDAEAIIPDILGRRRLDVWKMLRHYEQQAYRRGEEYESPWRKRIQRKSVHKKTTTRRLARGVRQEHSQGKWG